MKAKGQDSLTVLALTKILVVDSSYYISLVSHFEKFHLHQFPSFSPSSLELLSVHVVKLPCKLFRLSLNLKDNFRYSALLRRRETPVPFLSAAFPPGLCQLVSYGL